MGKRALIAGVTGQDGAYLAALLLGEGYQVVGLVRPSTTPFTSRLEALGVASDVAFSRADLLDPASLARVIEDARPDEVYNLAAQSSVALSWRRSPGGGQVTAAGAANLLEAVKRAAPHARFFQASSSEIFGLPERPLQDEASPSDPRSPYAAAKLYAHWMTACYRQSFGLHASAGILFNHESPLRSPEFVTRKVTEAAAKISLGLSHELRLGNVEARRDWGHAKDFVRAMWLMVRQDRPADFVIATGRAVSVRAMAQMAFDCVGLRLEDHLVIDPTLWRPTEAQVLAGDAGKARRELGWTPTVNLEALIAEMVEADLLRLRA